MNRVKRFFEQARYELRHVNWPTKKEAGRLTLVVIVISILLAAFLGFFDSIYSYILKIIVTNFG